MLYDFNCPSCKKTHEVERPMSRAGEPYACPDCGSPADRLYTASVPQEFREFYTANGVRIGTHKQDMANLRKHGRVLTQETNGWKDIKRMAKDGQRRTQLAQKGHY